LTGLHPKIPTNIPQGLVKLIESYWHQDPKNRINDLANKLNINYRKSRTRGNKISEKWKYKYFTN
ncbi:28253_t:CDS:1, partial [Racocetra persica]